MKCNTLIRCDRIMQNIDTICSYNFKLQPFYVTFQVNPARSTVLLEVFDENRVVSIYGITLFVVSSLNDR